MKIKFYSKLFKPKKNSIKISVFYLNLRIEKFKFI